MSGRSLRQRLFPGTENNQGPFKGLGVDLIYMGQQPPGTHVSGNENVPQTNFDPLSSFQRSRQAESQHSRLILGSRYPSPKADASSDDGLAYSVSCSTTPHNHTLPLPCRPPSIQCNLPKESSPQAPQNDLSVSQVLPLRPERSLRQLLNPGESQQPSIPGIFPSAIDPEHYSHREDIIPRSYSRSASVLSSVHVRQDDDISSIMMRGATDLRNTKLEVEELRRELALLHSQLESSAKEKDELSQRLKAVKDAAKQSLHASSKSLEAVRTAMNDLKTQSEESFCVITSLRASITDVHDLRASVSLAIKNIEPYLEPNEQWTKLRELREVMKTLELECSGSQQVADLLRDRLQSVGGELVDTKGRVAELEAAQCDDRAALNKANDIIRSTADQVSSLAASMNEQKNQLYDALLTSAQCEAKLQSAQERITGLQQLVTQKDEELQSRQMVQHENKRLVEMIACKDACIDAFSEVQPKVERLHDLIAKSEAHVAALKAVIVEKDLQITDLKSRLKCSEEANSGLIKNVQDLNCELRTSDALAQALSKENERLLKEKDIITVEVNHLQSTLSQQRQELDGRTEKLQQANSRYQALEERYEDQAITLRLTRESAGDAQERLLSAEAAHAKALAEVKAKLELDITVLQEQNNGMKTTMGIMDVAIKRQEACLSTIQEEHADRLKQQELSFSSRLKFEEQRSQQLSEDLREARARTASAELAEEHNTLLKHEIRVLQGQLHQAQMPSPEAEDELRTLRSRVSVLEAAEMNYILRAKTLDARYRVGDLNEEEKTFIQALIQTSQSIHEQELVASRNELRRRDNALKDIRSKAHRLEITLAKHLTDKKAAQAQAEAQAQAQAQAKEKAQAQAQAQSQAQEQENATVNPSMIDPTSWQSSSPLQAPDRDGLVLQPTNVDIPIAMEKTPAVKHNDCSDGAPKHATPGRNLSIAPQASTPPNAAMNKDANKPYFSRLATDCSDEILDLDDDVLSMRRPTPPSSLGKRRKSKSPFKTAEELQATKPLKRLRPGVRKTEMGANRTPTTAPMKSPQAGGSKPKPRKRR